MISILFDFLFAFGFDEGGAVTVQQMLSSTFFFLGYDSLIIKNRITNIVFCDATTLIVYYRTICIRRGFYRVRTYIQKTEY